MQTDKFGAVLAAAVETNRGKENLLCSLFSVETPKPVIMEVRFRHEMNIVGRKDFAIVLSGAVTYQLRDK